MCAGRDGHTVASWCSGRVEEQGEELSEGDLPSHRQVTGLPESHPGDPLLVVNSTHQKWCFVIVVLTVPTASSLFCPFGIKELLSPVSPSEPSALLINRKGQWFWLFCFAWQSWVRIIFASRSVSLHVNTATGPQGTGLCSVASFCVCCHWCHFLFEISGSLRSVPWPCIA